MTARHLIPLALLATAAALSACGGGSPAAAGGATAGKSDVPAWKGGANAHPAPGWKAGDQASWEQHMRARIQGQNEYAHGSGA
ncbi:MAG: hypothetical protein IPM99_27915 [Rubrivivax sp.]|jgi:hypothetical protein|nr:hypothetical protein [Rubrivivax sp.]